jgi:outer membrane protein TolC
MTPVAKQSMWMVLGALVQSKANARLRSAEEAYRARRDLFRYGRGTSVELADSEADLIRASLAAISAGIDKHLAKVRIEHATGRYVIGRGL